MRKIFLVFLCCVILSSCSDSNTKTVVEDDKELQIESIIEDYQDKLNTLNEENKNLAAQLDRLSERYRELLNEERPDVIVDSDDLMIVDGNRFRISIAGGKVLEDGVIIIFESYDAENYLSWLKIWEGIDVSELSLISQPTFYQDKVYIVVDGDLNILNLETGKTVMVINNVGKSDAAPVIDEDGTVFTIGQYAPYVTAINEEGIKIWQITDEELTHTIKVDIVDDLLQVETLRGMFILTKDGKVERFTDDDGK